MAALLSSLSAVFYYPKKILAGIAALVTHHRGIYIPYHRPYYLHPIWGQAAMEEYAALASNSMILLLIA